MQDRLHRRVSSQTATRGRFRWSTSRADGAREGSYSGVASNDVGQAVVDVDLHFDVRELSAKQIERLNRLTPAAGERHNQGNMAVIDR
ncbi:MAG TPA: hypothetical protein VK540_20700 [Polyangiaceae bacterium]|jgi:hypothetical protein|nr:hypothetical protein [Polyangiaceae bacterium]